MYLKPIIILSESNPWDKTQRITLSAVHTMQPKVFIRAKQLLLSCKPGMHDNVVRQSRGLRLNCMYNLYALLYYTAKHLYFIMGTLFCKLPRANMFMKIKSRDSQDVFNTSCHPFCRDNNIMSEIKYQVKLIKWFYSYLIPLCCQFRVYLPHIAPLFSLDRYKPGELTYFLCR